MNSDILELVTKLETMLINSGVEWEMTYDPDNKTWTFSIINK